jgi:quercetin dioxygenase-like cupin family protein
MQALRFPGLSGPYALVTAPPLTFDPVSLATVGLCRIGKGTRSPERGLRASASNEIGYVVRGHLRIDTAHASLEVREGDILTSSPTEPHSTTALEDSQIFFVLLDAR